MFQSTKFFLSLMTGRRGAFTVGRAVAELTIGVLLLARPRYAREILLYFFPVALGVLGLIGVFESMWGKSKSRRMLLAISGVIALGAGAGLWGLCGAKLALWSVGVWSFFSGVGFFIGGFSGEKLWPTRMIMLAMGIITVAFGGAVFAMNNRSFWNSTELLGVFFLALGVFSVAVSPLICPGEH